MFEKLFKSYIKNLIEKEVNLSETFHECYENEESKQFIEFLEQCLNEYPAEPDNWKFELGKMSYVLTRVLAKKPKIAIYKDFRNFFEYGF